MGDKQLKESFRKKASATPEKYYATSVLAAEGFSRKTCQTCRRHFWSTTEQRVCGDPSCSGGFRFFSDQPAKEKLDYLAVWKRFAAHFKQRGYEPIRRYPVAARWRDDTDFVQASIYDFQPSVVSGEVEPPANPLVVPQFCLRFNDIDNVGVTGAHYTGFVMLGQHAFMPPEKWDQQTYFRDIHSWLHDGLGLPNNEITYHEDAWAGGGNFGPCMEFFSRGLELGNQVYMQYEITPSGPKELNLKVLDMGMGHERNAWFTSGTSTSYETTFPTVCKKLRALTGITYDTDLLRRFLPYSSYLNVDEVADVDAEWNRIASLIGVDARVLKDTIQPLSALYSVAEHSRSLLVALSDGVLPSNAAGGYNLRVILRRALSFIDRYGWNVSLPDVCAWHAAYLKPLFPELSEQLSDVTTILDVEKRKHEETKKRSAIIVRRLLRQPRIVPDELVRLYDSDGISPDMIQAEAALAGKRVEIPDNFYALVADRHGQTAQRTASTRAEKLPLDGLPATEALFYADYTRVSFDARVVAIIGKHVVLDRTCFFATSGGQVHDTGALGNVRVIDVFRQGTHIVHVLAEPPLFSVGDAVSGAVDLARRTQLSQHHTVTHIFNAILRKTLGGHAWQCGTAKLPHKARLDMTHYDSLSPAQLKLFEKEANDVIRQNLRVTSRFEPRTEAEQRYGFGIYQGGVVPGKHIRIVEIDRLDVEACGGTHVHRTGDIGNTRIIRTSKVQDGVVRIEYVAGQAEASASAGHADVVAEIASLLRCAPNQTPGRAEELFRTWKRIVKKKKNEELTLSSTEKYGGDILMKVSEILQTQPEHAVKTIRRFLRDIESRKTS